MTATAAHLPQQKRVRLKLKAPELPPAAPARGLPSAGASTALADYVKRCNICMQSVGGERGLCRYPPFESKLELR